MSSVSRVLSGHADVSQVMRNRVLDAVAALGYEPDLLAQSLRRGVTMTVGFVVGNISNPLYAAIAEGAERNLRTVGYSMLLANSVGDPALDRANIRLLAQRRVDGLLLSLADESAQDTADAVAQAGIPTVMVDREPGRFPGASAVLSDHATGMETAVSTLIGLGHTRIALVNGPLNVRPAAERAAALRRTCRRYPRVKALVRSGSFTEQHGRLATTVLLKSSLAPTAIIAGSNQILGGVLAALDDLGYSVPSDVSLATCDDIALSNFLKPPLATISRDPSQIGQEAATLLRELMGGGQPRTLVVPTSFRPTQSCGAPSTAGG